MLHFNLSTYVSIDVLLRLILVNLYPLLDRVIMAGGFNMHVNDVSRTCAADFIIYFNFIQHVSGHSHIRGHTLDLDFTL